MRKAVRGTWNFILQPAMLAQNVPARCNLNMDVNLHRLPDETISFLKFIVPLAGFLPHPHTTDSDAMQ